MQHLAWIGSSLAVLTAFVAAAACGGSGGETTTGGFGGSGGVAATSSAGGSGGRDPSGVGGSGGGLFTVGSSGSGGSPDPMTDVNVVITADNAYSFGYGDGKSITHYTQGSRALSAGEIFNCGEGPEAYTVPAADAPPSAYLYVVTWDDLSVTQGVLGQFLRVGGKPLYTGDPKFEVCATGIDLSASQVGPTQDEVNAQIKICNAGSGDKTMTSGGWVNGNGAVTAGAVGKLAVGEANDPMAGGTFPPTCPTGSAPPGSATIDTVAHWMWYQPGGIADPFHSTGSNTFRAYLIFRVAAHDLPPVPK